MPLPTIRPPADNAFNGDDFLVSPEIEAIAEDLRERHNLPPEIDIAYRWKRKASKSGDKVILGKCLKLSGPAKHFGQVDFLVWLAADACRDVKLTQDQYVNRIYHELLHAGVEYEKDTGKAKPISRGHDFEEFSDVIRDYGLWNDAQRDFIVTATQAPLFDVIDGPKPQNGRQSGNGLEAVDKAVASVFAP